MFSQRLTLSRKLYKIRTLLLYNINSKSYNYDLLNCAIDVILSDLSLKVVIFIKNLVGANISENAA